MTENRTKLFYSREDMLQMNIETLANRGVQLEEIALIAYNQQSRYNANVQMSDCLESVEKILSLRDIFHFLQFGVEIDRLTEENMFRGPIQDIMRHDLGVFGIDEVVGLSIAGLYGIIGQTNFGDIDVNKPGVVARLNGDGKHQEGKKSQCHTFLDDIVGAIAAAASTRVAQMISEQEAHKELNVEVLKMDI